MTTEPRKRDFVRWIAVKAVFLAVASIMIACGRSSPSTTAVTGINQSVLDKIKKTAVLNACDIVYPPFVVQDPQTKNLSGYFIDLMADIAKEGKFSVNYQETDWATMITALQTGKCDVVVSGVFPTIARAKEVTFATPLLYVGLSGIARKADGRFKTAADLAQGSITIAVTSGEVGDEYAKAFLPNAKLIELQTADISRPMLEVLSGRADIALGDSLTACLFTKAHPDVKDVFANNPLRVYGTTFMIRSGDPQWEDFLNTSIQEMELSGVTAQLETKYKECPSAWISKSKL